MTEPAPESGLSDRLARNRPLSVPIWPRLDRLLGMLDTVSEKYDDPKGAKAMNAQVHLELMHNKVTSGNWDNTPLGFVTQAASHAFDEGFREDGRYTTVRNFLYAEIRATGREAFLNPMARIYMDSFVPRAAHTQMLGTLLSAARSRLGQKWQRMLSEIPTFFHPNTVVDDIARRMVAMPEPWEGLRALGLMNPHAPGLMDAVHLAYINQIRPELVTVDGIERFLRWIKPKGQSQRRVGAGQAITSLIWPWLATVPPPHIRDLLASRITDLYGHPRADRDPAWSQVDPAAERVFMQWLMAWDFEFLFRVLKKVEPSHMFPDREKFWRKQLEEGRVQELWVAFKPEGYREAVSLMPHDMRGKNRRFALQTGDKDKSLLLMRIGNKIVVEGTHNFMLHFFDYHSPDAPKLYEERYNVVNIRHRPNLEAFTHTGGWQAKAQSRL